MTKFSKDFRVKLMKEIDQGEPLDIVARKYGVGRSTLLQWYANYSHGGVKQLVSDNKQQYTLEFKIYAIEYRWSHDLSYRLAAAELDIPNGSTLYQWEKRYLESGASSLTTEKGRPPKMPRKKEKPKRDLTREEQLEAENAQLRMENAYLKKLNALVQEREKSKKKIK